MLRLRQRNEIMLSISYRIGAWQFILSSHISGHGQGLLVFPGCKHYVRPGMTSLKLREKFFSFSGDDCTVKDVEGRDWFKIEGSALSVNSERSMTDHKWAWRFRIQTNKNVNDSRLFLEASWLQATERNSSVSMQRHTLLSKQMVCYLNSGFRFSIGSFTLNKQRESSTHNQAIHADHDNQ